MNNEQMEDRALVKLALCAATGFWNDKVSGDAVDQAESALLSRFAALRAERDALAKRVATLEIAVVRACVPLEAFWADEGSRRYVAPSLRPLFEDAIATGRAAIAGRKGDG